MAMCLSLGCYHKRPDGMAYTVDSYFLTVLEVGKSEIKLLADMVLSNTLFLVAGGHLLLFPHVVSESSELSSSL